MPDELTKIGLDTADISRALDRVSGQIDGKLGRSAKNADDKVKGLGKTLKDVFVAVGLFKGMQAAVNLLRNYGDELERIREKQIAGTQASKNFNDASRYAGEQQLTWARQMTDQLSNLATAWKGIAIDFAMVSAKKMGFKIPDAGSTGSGTSQAAILKSEDELTTLREQSLSSERERIAIMEKERELELVKIAFFSQEAHADREKLNSARERAQALYNEIKIADENLKNSEAIAKAQRLATEFEMAGNNHAMNSAKIIADYESKIANARKAGRLELEAQLVAQKQQALIANKAVENRMTPLEKLRVRQAARKDISDAKKQDKREEEFARRTDRGIVGEKGSPLAAWQARKAVVDGKNNKMIIGGDAIKYLETMAKNSEANLSVERK